jgi:hypothetical protein
LTVSPEILALIREAKSGQLRKRLISQERERQVGESEGDPTRLVHEAPQAPPKLDGPSDDKTPWMLSEAQDKLSPGQRAGAMEDGFGTDYLSVPWSSSNGWWWADAQESRELWTKRVVSILWDSGDPQLRNRAIELSECRQHHIFQQAKGPDGEIMGRVLPRSCDDKFCPYCLDHRNRNISKLYQALLDEKKKGIPVLHLVLSVPHDKSQSCKEVRKRLTDAWGRFRRLKEFREHIDGGCLKIESTDTENGFHVHGHVLCTGSYWDKDAFHAAWGFAARIEGPNASRIGAAPDNTSEFKSYALKANEATMSPEALIEYAKTTHRSRDHRPFGRWKTWQQKMLAEEAAEDAAEDKPIWGAVDEAEIAVKASQGDAEARELVDAWRDGWRVVYAKRKARERRQAEREEKRRKKREEDKRGSFLSARKEHADRAKRRREEWK